MSIFKKIFAAIGGAATAVGHFFANAFKWVETDGAKIAVAILEEFKTLQGSGVINFFAKIADALTKSQIPTNVVAKINAALPNLMADAVGIQGLGKNPTDDQLQALSQQIMTEWGMTDNKSKLYSVVGTDIIGIIRKESQPGANFNFAEAMADLQTAYTDYKDALAAETADPNATPAS